MSSGRNLLFPLLAAALFLCPDPARVYAGYGEHRPNELVCEMLPGYSIEIINGDYGTTVKRLQPQTGCYLLATPGGQTAESLAVIIDARPEVLYCGLNYYLSTPEGLQRSQPFLDVQFDGDYEAQDAALTLKLDSTHLVNTGTDVAIALIDGGVNFDHPELVDANLVSVWDYVDDDSLAFDEPDGSGSGHGTFVAGVLHLVAPEAELYVYRTLDTSGRGTGYDIATALLHAVDNGCRIANLSLGMIGVENSLDEAIHYAWQQDVIVVAAAGNDSTSDPEVFPYPAWEVECISVAATDTLNLKADFSNFGPPVDYCAPGTRIYGPYLDTSYAWWDGTSFAAPFVTGLATLVLSLDPSLTRPEVDTLLALTAQSLDSLNPGLEGQLGHGLISPLDLVKLLAAGTGGDVDLDGEVALDDAIHLVDYVFKSGVPPCLWDSGDVNCDGTITSADIIYLVRYIFLGGPDPC